VLKPYPKNSIGLQAANLEVVSVTKVTPKDASQAASPYKSTFQIDLRTDHVALYVWIEAIGESAGKVKTCCQSFPN
jgi:hypothetical protein